MGRQFLTSVFRSANKTAKLLILCIAALLSACGGQNDGMQTLASREVPYFYAVGMDATNQAYLIVGNTEGYYMEYVIPGYIAPTGQAGMCMSRSGRVYIGETNTVYISSSGDYSSWSSQVIGAGIRSFASTPSGDFLLQCDATPLELWRFEESSNRWENKGKTTGLTNTSKCLYSPSFYKLLVLGHNGADTYIQELTTATALKNYAYYPFIEIFNYNFFEELNGGIYIGNSTQGLFLFDVLIGPGTNLYSYAVVSPTEIFAGNDLNTPPLRVFRLVGGSFITELIFPGSGMGQVRLWQIPPDHILIGLGGLTAADGLYLYDFRKLKLKKLSSMTITAVYSRTR